MSLILRTALLLIVISGCAARAHRRDAHSLSLASKLIDSGVIYLREGRLNLADSAFAASFDIVSSAAALDGRGCVALRQGRLADAESFFLGASEQDPSYGRALQHLALVREESGSGSRARPLFERAVELEPDDFMLRNDFAVHLADHGSTSGDLLLAGSELGKALVLRAVPEISSNIEKLNEERRQVGQ